MIREYIRNMTWEEKFYIVYKEICDLKLKYSVDEVYYNEDLEINLNRLYRLISLSDMCVEIMINNEGDFEREYYNLKYIHKKALELHLLCISILAIDGYTEKEHKTIGGNVL